MSDSLLPRRSTKPIEIQKSPVGTTWEDRGGVFEETTEELSSELARVVNSFETFGTQVTRHGFRDLKIQATQVAMHRAGFIAASGLHYGPIEPREIEIYDSDDEVGLEIVESRVAELETKFDCVQGDIGSIEVRLEALRTEFKELSAQYHRTQPAGALTYGQVEAITRQIAKVSKLYTVADPACLVQHFSVRPWLAELLHDCAAQLQERFGGGSAVLADEEGELVLRIPTSHPPAVAHVRFSAFLREWWMPRAGTEDKMTLTLEYA